MTVPQAYLAWGGSILAGLLVYSLVMARRSLVEPVEIPALMRTLPVTTNAAIAAKVAAALLRITTIAVLGGLPLVLRAPDMLGTVVFVGASVTLAIFASSVWCRRL